jgi:diacylglycerol kinase family enzyme
MAIVARTAETLYPQRPPATPSRQAVFGYGLGTAFAAKSSRTATLARKTDGGKKDARDLNKHCTVLLNTRAGALKARPGIAQIQQMAQQIGLDAEVLAVPSSQEMRPMVRQLVRAGVEKIAIAGGDGTVALAVQELAYSDSALGILPQGTFNNFATALRLPLNLPGALRVLRDGHVHEVSLGKIGERYFTEVAGVGLFADALALYGHGGGKNFARGLITLTRLALSVRARRIRLTLDGEYHEERA